MTTIKKYNKKSQSCKVTFRVPAEAAQGASRIYLVGDFNDWDAKAHPMRKAKDGGYSITLDLEMDKEYQYRYLMHSADGGVWENDWSADKYVHSTFAGCDNSVVVV